MNSTTAPRILKVIFVFLVLFAVLVTPDGVIKQNTLLTANSPVHCDTIIEVSTFEGDCCSLNVTAGNGCVLNVLNGRCVIKGQYWSLDYESTSNNGECPPGEYMLGITEFPTMSPHPDSGATPVAQQPSGPSLQGVIIEGSGACRPFNWLMFATGFFVLLSAIV